MIPVALDVLGQKFSSNGARGYHAVVTIKSGKFGKVVGEIECSGRRVGIFVVDELNRFNFFIRLG